MSALRNPDEIKLKKKWTPALNSDFIDSSTSAAADNPMEQLPEQTGAPPSAASAPQQPSSSSDDDVMDPLPSDNDACDICHKMKDAWEQTHPAESFPDERICASMDDASRSCCALLKTNLKGGFIAKHPANYRATSKSCLSFPPVKAGQLSVAWIKTGVLVFVFLCC